MPAEAHRIWIRITALVCVVLLARGEGIISTQAQSPTVQAAPTAQSTVLSPDQLDSLVAPIALYPDPLLAQVLAASTYPLELIQLQQWLQKHTNLKDKALADAVEKQGWDPSVQAMAGLPDVVKQLAENIQWASELGNAFLAQQSDVMDAVQRMRMKAKDSDKLQSTEQMKVETKVVDSKNVVVIEQANPEVIYVPSYNPTVVWGPPPYPYPPVAYPPPGYYAAGMALSFGVGIAMGALWSGGWGWNCGWGGNNNITINNNNFFNKNSVNNIGNRTGTGNRGSQWQHNPQHRGGAPYGDRATADRFGGSTRGDSLGRRQSNAREQIARSDRNIGANRGAANDRNVGANRAFEGDRNAGANRGASNDRNLGANRGAGSDRSVGGNRGGAGADRIGNRQISGGGAGQGAFGGAGRNSGRAARADAARGASSMRGGRGGGGGGRSVGGGGRGGGRRR